MRRIGTISFFIAIVVAVMGLVYLGSGPTAWATPSQNPQAQTVPTPPPPLPPTPAPTPIPVTPAPTPTPAPGGGVGTITYASGGSVTTPDGNTTMTVPPGAVAQTSVDMTLTPKNVADAPSPPSGVTVVGAFAIQTFVSGAPQASYTFMQAVTICTKITQAQLDAVKGDVSKIVIMRYDDNLKAWTSLTTAVDLVALTACATTRSLSTFALGIKGAVVAPTPTPTAKLPAGDIYLSGGSSWWLGLAVLGLFLVLFGGLALRRTTRRNS